MENNEILINSFNIIDKNNITHLSFEFLTKIINRPIKQIRQSEYFYEFCVEIDQEDYTVCFSPIQHHNNEWAIGVKEATLEELDDINKIRIANWSFFQDTVLKDVSIRFGDEEANKGGLLSFEIGNSSEISDFILHWCYSLDRFELCTTFNASYFITQYYELVKKFPYKLSLLDKKRYEKFYI